jgi:hypothetical protein
LFVSQSFALATASMSLQAGSLASSRHFWMIVLGLPVVVTSILPLVNSPGKLQELMSRSARWENSTENV